MGKPKFLIYLDGYIQHVCMNMYAHTDIHNLRSLKTEMTCFQKLVILFTFKQRITMALTIL
jgi:hypothetical protein